VATPFFFRARLLRRVVSAGATFKSGDIVLAFSTTSTAQEIASIGRHRFSKWNDLMPSASRALLIKLTVLF
jgi:L-aminopeptidase/D-esterase-like protein